MSNPLDRRFPVGLHPRALTRELRDERRTEAAQPNHSVPSGHYARYVLWGDSGEVILPPDLPIRTMRSAHLKLIGRSAMHSIAEIYGLPWDKFDEARRRLGNNKKPRIVGGVGNVHLSPVPAEGRHVYRVDAEVASLRLGGKEYDPRQDMVRLLDIFELPDAEAIAAMLPDPEFRLGGIRTSDPIAVELQLQAAFSSTELALASPAIKK